MVRICVCMKCGRRRCARFRARRVLCWCGMWILCDLLWIMIKLND